MSTVMPRLERRSILTGTAATLALAVPPALIGLLLSKDDSMEGSAWVPFLFFWIIAAFLVGGFVAARLQPHAPLAHGAVAVVVAYLLVQGVGVTRRLIVDEDISWLSIPFLALLASSTGMVGGMVANRMRVRRSGSPPERLDTPS